MPKPNQQLYGFSDRFRVEFPSQVIIDATDVCNLACAHCPHAQFVQTDFYQGCFLDPELSRKAVDEVRGHGKGITQHIRFTGEGEPLLHKRIHEMLGYAVKNSGVLVSLTTNGTLMDGRHSEKLLESGVQMVDISIDAFAPDTYAKIRRNGNLEVTRSNVLRLIDLARRQNSGLKVVVSYIEQPLNKNETEDFRTFWEEHGAHYVVVRRQHSGAGMIEEVARTMKSLEAPNSRRPCTYPWERIILNPRGFLSFCPADWQHLSTVADYRVDTIKSVWTGETMQKLREAHLNNDYSDLPCCEQCPDWSATRWPTEGRSYADLVVEVGIPDARKPSHGDAGE